MHLFKKTVILFGLFISPFFANGSEMTFSNNSKTLIYNIALEFEAQSFNADIQPGTRKTAAEITGCTQEDMPDYMKMSISASYKDEIYQHQRSWVEKNTFVALFDPQERNVDRLFCKFMPRYSFKRSYLSKEGQMFSERGRYPNYAVYFNAVDEKVEAYPLAGQTINSLLFRFNEIFSGESFPVFLESLADYGDEKLLCAFPGLVDNGFVRKEHLKQAIEKFMSSGDRDSSTFRNITHVGADFLSGCGALQSEDVRPTSRAMTLGMSYRF